MKALAAQGIYPMSRRQVCPRAGLDGLETDKFPYNESQRDALFLKFI